MKGNNPKQDLNRASGNNPDGNTPSPPSPPDPYDPARLRLTQDFATAAGVRRVHAIIPVRKPANTWFVRTHPDEAYRLETAVLEIKEDRETYLVAPEIRPELVAEPAFSPRLLVTAVNRQGVPFVWPIRLPGPDGRIDSWSQSALEAANDARDAWVRVSANMGLGGYEISVAPAQHAEPIWPDLPFAKILEIAFRDKLIDRRDHPVLRRLRGEV
jgi:hypothetical protein